MSRVEPSRRGTAFAYAGMIGGTSLAFLLVRRAGNSLTAEPSVHPATTPAVTTHSADATLWHVLLALAVIVLVARAFGALARLFKQPAVMGEIVAGLLLGPSCLGAIAPSATAFLVPTEIAPQLGVVAKLGVVLFMFLVGLELDTRLLRGSSRATFAISHASIALPFLLGAGLALYLYPRYSTASVSFTSFALFVGVSMAVTAFPVLARILSDRGVHRSPLGITALACAAINDVTAWCLLALVSGVAAAEWTGMTKTVLALVVYAAFVVGVARPALHSLAAREERLPREIAVSHTVLAVVFASVLLSAVATEAMGVHALFGAFVVGAILPHEGRLAEQVRHRMEDLVVVMLLPLFFAWSGLRTPIGLVTSPADWATVAAIVAVATIGKAGGTFVAARLAHFPWRDATALGVLMNTRGLMELIVLNVGLDMGILSPKLFVMLTIMALVTTFATAPLFAWVSKGLASLRTVSDERRTECADSRAVTND